MKHSKSNQKDIIVLLGGLLIFSCGISLLYGISANQAVTPLDDKEILSAIQPLDATGGVKKMAAIIAQSPFAQQVRILNHVLNNQASALSPEEKIELGLSLLAKRSSVSEQKTLLDTMNNFPGILKVPLLYIAIEKKQIQTIPMLVNYFKNKANELEKNTYQALIHALKQNNLQTFTQIINALGGISSQMATSLLWDVLQEKKDAQFVPILVSQKADVNNGKEGKTPLIAAVDLNNVEMVQMLLDNGALPNKFVDPVVGTPLQHAQKIQKESKTKNSTIELLLRDRGAKE